MTQGKFPNNKRTRPVFKIGAIDDQEKFQPLPAPIGPHPFHLDIKRILPGIPEDKLNFQACGDTGGIVLPTFQHRVVREMTRQFKEPELPGNRPQFFLHLGDVVYNYGQQSGYYEQFFDPFKHYPAPIFAIPGNHDADIDPFDASHPKSLDAFTKVFCTGKPTPIAFAGDTHFDSNIQPNIYWTLKTPVANIICLYGNVPRFGTITADQKEWFTEELKIAEKERDVKAIIVCVHHPPYSADTNHGSNLRMQLFFDEILQATNTLPDIVLSGHVHNYQRFSKSYPNGKTVPFIVAGAGGYAQLHSIAQLNDPDFPDNSKLLDDVRLENYCDTTHGFLNISIQKSEKEFVLNGSYYVISHDDERAPATLFDNFTVNLRQQA